MREIFLSTGIHCEKLDTDQSRKGKKPAKKPYSWTSQKDLTLSNLEDYLFSEPKDITDLEKTEETEAPMEEDEKLCLAAVILTKAFLMTPHSLEKIPSSRLHHASDLEAYTSLAWGKEAYNVLATSIKRMDTNTWARRQYEVKGFPLALLIWSFSAVPLFGATFAVCNDTSKCVYPLYSYWESSLTPRLDQIVDAIQSSDCIEVKSIIGDPE
ncbi:uncharacterized protein LOC17874434 [Capsella rubella]|uniref:uncharacterized protein LOC17874434 n=1 Tax=Capsella rubella TaxID=81985 RepID=UPI000CD4CEFE|nr:uncharacterized protein LOC17874434 [Capsella rubella]